MKDHFLNIYNHIIESGDEAKMKVLGGITKQLMNRLIDTAPALAEEYIEQLESVKWDNYLTKKEAENIVSDMSPKPQMSKSSWESMLENRISEECPYYNKCALYTTMQMIYSDSYETLSKVVSDKNQLFDLIYHLAIDKLKDKDKMFNIRKYFGLL